MLLPNPPTNHSSNPLIHLRVGSNSGNPLESLLSALRTQIVPHFSMLGGEVDRQGNIIICIEGSEDMTGEEMSFLVDLPRVLSEEEGVEMHLVQFSLEE